MSTSPLSSPVVLDASLTDEKLAELLSHQTEYPDLDYKSKIDITTKEGVIELAKDVGAMQVRGGYIIVGADNQGELTGDLDGADTQPFNEANLTPKLQRYLPEHLELRTRAFVRHGHTVVMIYVGPHPSGCAFFRAVGQYVKKNGKTEVAFRKGDVFWRNGTRSERMDQRGLEAVIERRVAEAKSGWLEEQHEIRRQERAEIEGSVEAQRTARSSLGAVNLDLEASVLVSAALELLREDDQIALRHLLNDALGRARRAIERDEIETELPDVVDKLACLAAAFLEYEQERWFEEVVATLGRIYSEGFGGQHPDRFDLPASISPSEAAPRIWLLVIERVYGLGALAVRLRNWGAVGALALQLPRGVDDSYGGWLRHALTMASRAQHLQEPQGERMVEVNLLSRSGTVVERSDCLRADGADAEAIVTSLARFDFLAGLAVIGSTAADDHAFYPNFAQFRHSRVQPIAEEFLKNAEMRQTLFPGTDPELATALRFIEEYAHRVGIRFDGFESWRRTPVEDFVEQHLPPESRQRFSGF